MTPSSNPVVAGSESTRPADARLPQTAVIDRIQPEIDGVSTYDLRLVDDQQQQAFGFLPGQFNMLYFPGAGEIAISISDDPSRRDAIAHTIRVAGNVTGCLATKRPGDTLGLRGPFGSGWPIDQCIGRDVLLVAGGVGLAPLRPVIHTLLAQRRRFGQLHLLVGARHPDLLLFADQYDQWTERGLMIHRTVDRCSGEWTGHVGVVTLLLERLKTFDPDNSVLFCCGPEVMMRFTATTALRCGVGPQRTWVSMERNMQCGVGLCGHCQFGPSFVCMDGPVYCYDQLAAYLDVEEL